MSLRWYCRANVIAAGAVLIWAAAATAGFAMLTRYKSTPGELEGPPPERWPSQSSLQPAADRHTLVLFAHPHCPCTHASISELARLMTHSADRMALRVVIVKPEGVGQGWDDTELRRRAASVEGATVVLDEGGVEAARFRANVSGFTVLYDAGGRLRFAGGITSARGHEGDSFGQRRIAAVLAGTAADRSDAPVFGCSLVGADHARMSHPVEEGS
jgi:hypothetical protein